MRKAKLYISCFRVPLVLLAIALLCWIYLPKGLSEFRGSLIGTTIGVGLSISAAESFKKLVEHRRRKKTLGLIKLTTIPYLKNQAENFLKTLESHADICSFEQAVKFLALSSHLNEVAVNTDKSWLSLIYSEEFLDALNSDEHFNAIAAAIQEVLLFIAQLASQSVNSKILFMNDFAKLNDDQRKEIIKRAQGTRNSLRESVLKLQKYIDKLDEEIMKFLPSSGAHFEEYER